jgi:hypothetical protein
MMPILNQLACHVVKCTGQHPSEQYSVFQSRDIAERTLRQLACLERFAPKASRVILLVLKGNFR